MLATLQWHGHQTRVWILLVIRVRQGSLVAKALFARSLESRGRERGRETCPPHRIEASALLLPTWGISRGQNSLENVKINHFRICRWQ